jgi:hypothetical protein
VEFHVAEDEDTEEAALDTNFQKLAGIGDGRRKEKKNRDE